LLDATSALLATATPAGPTPCGWRPEGGRPGHFARHRQRLRAGLFRPAFRRLWLGSAAVAIAPILGHAFSPFLKFRGGKALAATGGVWLALVGLPALFAYAVLAVPFTLLQEEDALSANAGMVSLLVYAALRGPAWLFAFAALNAALIVWTHRRDLFRLPQWRPWVADIFSRRGA
jgi:glycerol-3-phosphate acyltransferase PlsY